MARKLRITVDHNVCMGTTMCVQFAPNVFKLNEERHAEAISQDGDTEDNIIAAAENCPVGAIRVVDADTGEAIFEM